ncbi:fluoride efflux transporter FluC [Sporolactobacillus spathodeae]|uniref:Fluoride-specific ion channel FluC n=1 Tax=Sporolactobacillus spathodeae TaxID=1465502 RepID=A0ABS2Q7C6_9BACL|nr:CrcB family protein [Sporolactobacillus spathodeae]MBM7657682.1 CrcB protein [Sporolactobacillus spathodeae]
MSYFLFALFGILGALARYSLEWMIPSHAFPFATLLINLVGCFLLAFVTRFLVWIPGFSQRFVSIIGTGFVGSFTTFSTFTLETAQAMQRGAYLTAAVYFLLSAIGGLIACLIGYKFSKYLLTRKRRTTHAR